MQSFWQNAGGLLKLDSASGFVEKAKEAAAKVADAAAQVSDTVQAEYRRTFVDLDCEIYAIRPNLSVMEFPSEEKIDRLATRLNADYGQRMLILNMSERKYDTAKFSGEVVDVAFRGLPAPPVELLMELCLSAHHWLESDADHAVIVHCFQGYSRSAVFVSCFLAFRGLYEHPVDALSEVCGKLGLSEKTAVVPSQRRYLTYFQQCQQGLSPPRTRLRLQRAQLNGVPRFEKEGNVVFRPYIEVWNKGELVHSSLPDIPGGEPSRPGGAGAAPNDKTVVSLPAGLAETDPCVSFPLPPDNFVSGDVLIRVRHVYADGKPDTALRLAFHTGIVPEGAHFGKHELDTACDDDRFPDGFFLDLIFEVAPVDPEADDAAEHAKAAAVFEKARELGKRNKEEEQKRAELAAQQAAKEGQATADTADDDHFAALEAKLRGGPGSGVPAASSGRGALHGDAAEELKRALAAAAAGNDSPVSAISAKTPAAKSVPATESEAASPDATPKAPTGGVPPKGPSAADVKAQSEIDDLFDEFDAVLASVGGETGASSKGGGAKKKVSSDDKAASDNPFGDVDDFLKELDA